MKTRLIAVAFLALFTLAPSAFAVGASGSWDSDNSLLPNGSSCYRSAQCASGCCNDGGACATADSCATTNNQSPQGPVGAQTQSPQGPTGSGQNITLINPLGAGTNVEKLVNQILAFVIRIGSIVVILMMVYVGYLFVIARGNPTEITKARQALLWTVVGALILLGAQAISLGIQATVQALSVGG